MRRLLELIWLIIVVAGIYTVSHINEDATNKSLVYKDF